MKTLVEPDLVRRFLRLASLNILSNSMVPLAGLLDIAFLGHLDTLEPLSGVALATTLFNVMYWPFGFLRMGTVGPTAQARGRHDPEQVLLVGLRHWLLALLLGVGVLSLHRPLADLGFSLLQGSETIKQAGRLYYEARILGSPAYFFNLVCIGWFLGQEQGRKVLLMSVVNNGANVLLNYELVVRLGLASQGAGMATALADLCTFILALGLMVPLVSWPQVQAVKSQIFETKSLKTAFLFNRDILVRTFALVMTFALFTNISSALGSDILVVNTLMMQVVTLAAYGIDGYAFATESLAGIFYGGRQIGKLRGLLWLSGSVSLLTGLVIAATFTLFPHSLFALLTNQPTLLNQIANYVSWLIPVLGFGSIAYMLDGYFLGLTQGQVLRNASLIASLTGFGPLAALAWYWQDPHVLWGAMVSYMAARDVTLGINVSENLKVQD